MNRYSTGYAKSLVAATPEDQLIAGRRKIIKGLTTEQIALMERESASLDREFKLIEQTYGAKVIISSPRVCHIGFSRVNVAKCPLI